MTIVPWRDADGRLIAFLPHDSLILEGLPRSATAIVTDSVVLGYGCSAQTSESIALGSDAVPWTPNENTRVPANEDPR